MCGGYAPLKDLYKTEVYALARWRNTVGGAPVIPRGGDRAPPSAELRENQTDQDSLPPYDVLDAILYRFVDLEQSQAEIVARASTPPPSSACCTWCASASGSATRPRRARRSRAAPSAASGAIRSAAADTRDRGRKPRGGLRDERGTLFRLPQTASERQRTARSAPMNDAATGQPRRLPPAAASNGQKARFSASCRSGRHAAGRWRAARAGVVGQRVLAQPRVALGHHRQRIALVGRSAGRARARTGRAWRGDPGAAAQVVLADVDLVPRHLVAQVDHALAGVGGVAAVRIAADQLGEVVEALPQRGLVALRACRSAPAGRGALSRLEVDQARR
jgi:hypothetical protein